MDVDAGAQESVDPVRYHLDAEVCIEFFHKVGVECRCETCSVGKCESLLAGIESHSRGTVRAAQRGYAECLEFFGDASEACGCTHRYLGTSHSLSSYDEAEVFVGQLCDEFIHCMFAALNIGKLYALVARLRYLGINSVEA